MTNNWVDWPDTVHDSPDQQKRYVSALDYKLTPTSIDRDSQRAAFVGRHGSYITTLKDCTCIDFQSRHLPCKHMYRLAMELHLYPGNFYSYTMGGVDWIDASDLIDKLSIETEKEFYYNYYQTYKKKDGYKRKKSPELDELIEKGYVIELAPDTPKFRTVRMIFDFYENYLKLKQYMERKLYNNRYDIYGDPLLYPDDDVSELLISKGFLDPSKVRS